MKCPLCDVDLQMAERQGIEIDYCPKCRGVWLDRGELDKIIERTHTASQGASEPRRQDSAHHEDARRYDDHGRDDHKHKKKKSPTSLLGDLFDF